MNKNLKAGIWYTMSNFINKGIAYLTTPIFTRLLSKEEYGDFSNFLSWSSLLIVVTSMDLYTSINKAYYDDKEGFDEYLSTISCANIGFTALIYLIVLIFKRNFIQIFNMDEKYIHIMFLYLLFYPAYNFFMSQQRLLKKYRLFSAVSIFSSIAIMFVSVLFVVKMSDKLMARAIGYVLPIVLINLVIYFYFFYHGKKFIWSKLKYALAISIPLIPHNISGGILTNSDRIIIKYFWGSSEVAAYSVAYTYSMIVTLFQTSINQAYVPWLYDKLYDENFTGIKKNMLYIIVGFFFLVFGTILVAPDAIRLIGGVQYTEAINIVPLVMLGCSFQFIYSFYVNLEYYSKKTFGVSIGTMTAAFVNFVLNLLIVPQYGYVGAAFTTLIGYMILYAIHFAMTRKLEHAHLYDNKKIFVILLCFSMICFLIYPLYKLVWLRLLVLLVYSVVFVTVAYYFIVKWKKIKNS